jgi:hypothetical protein
MDQHHLLLLLLAALAVLLVWLRGSCWPALVLLLAWRRSHPGAGVPCRCWLLVTWWAAGPAAH